MAGSAILQVNPADSCLFCVKKDGSFYDLSSYTSDYKFVFGEQWRRFVVRRDAAGIVEVFVDGVSAFVTGVCVGSERAKLGRELFVFYHSDSGASPNTLD